MKKLRKLITVSVAMMTILSMSVVVAPNAGAAASAGDLIKRDGLSAVYYLASDGQRYIFSDSTTYFSWYNDFSGVRTISQTELESYPLGKNVTMRPGTKLIKVTTDPKVYAVEPGGKLAWVKTEAAAKALFGDNWAKRIVDVNDSFFVNSYNRTTIKELDGTAFPAGSLIKGTGADIYYINTDGKAQKITSEAAFNANRFKMSDVITTTIAIPAAGADITGAETTLTDTSSGAGGTIATGGSGLTVALASDNPAAANIPAGSPNSFLKISLTAASDGAVKVSTIKLRAYELGTATNIDSVTFYDNGVKVGTARDVNSDKEATFNFSTPIEVAAGTTKSLLVKATIAAASTGNYALGIASAADIITGGATVSGTFPVRGNMQAIVSGTTIGTVTMSSVGSTDTNNNFGDDNVLLASFDLTAANEPIIFESMRMKNGGTNTAGIVGNMRVLIDGDEVVKGAELVDKFVNFNMANTVIAKNDTVTVEVYGDLGIANVNNTVNLYFDDANDLVFTGKDYGYGIQIASSGFGSLDTATTDGIIVTLAAGDVTIDMDKTATPAKDVRPGDNAVVLATIKILSSGENATITSLKENGANEFVISGTGLNCNELDNVSLKDVASGAVYDAAIATSTNTAKCKLTITDEIALVKGVTKTFQLRADIAGSTDTNTADSGDTYQVTLEDGAFAITGDTSDASLATSITPTSVSSAIATVKTSSLTWQTTALTNKTIVPGAKDVVVYSAGLETGASSAVTLTSVKISATSTSATAFDDNNISQLKLYVDGKLVKTSAGNITEAVVGTTAGYINFTSLDTVNRVIPAGKTVTLEVKADFAASFSPAGYIQLAIANGTSDIVAKDVDNNNVVESVSNVGTLSRTVILNTVGTLKVELTTTDLKSNANTIVLAGGKTTSGDKYLAKLTFTTANEPIKVKTLVLGNAGTATADDILSVDLYTKDGVLVASKAVSTAGHANFSDLNLTLAADNAHEYFIGVTAKGINVENDPSSSATFARTAKYTLASSTQLTALGLSADKAVTAQGVDSGTAITIVEDTDNTVAVGEYATGWFGTATSTTATITGALLTSITNPMSNTTLSDGNDQVIGKYTFVFDNGNNRTATNAELKAALIQLILTISTSTGTLVSNVQAYIDGDSANKTTAVAPVSGVATIDLATLPDVSELVDGTVTLIIEADVSGTTSADFVQTKINSLATDFTYNGNNRSGANNTSNALLPYTEVIGAKLSN